MNDSERKAFYIVIKNISDRISELEVKNQTLLQEWIQEKENHLKWQQSIEEKILK